MHINKKVIDQICILMIDRQDALNAMNPDILRELDQAIKTCISDQNIGVIILTGAGDKAFIAGADIKVMQDLDVKGAVNFAKLGQEVTMTIEDSPKPIIAAFNGPAVGVGVTMTLPMDIRIASEEAKFGFVFARRGLVPEAASSWFLPRVVGINKALEWTFSGRVFSPEEAKEGGLIRSIHPADKLLEEANKIAQEIVENTSAVSVAMTRQMLWKLLGADHPMEAHKVDSRAIYELGQGGDAKEGVESFLEKRPPEFPSKVSEDMPEFYPWWEERKFK